MIQSIDIPTEEGLYEYCCLEIDFKWCSAAIIEKDNILRVHEEGLGVTPLEDFHNGLTDIKWRKIA